MVLVLLLGLLVILCSFAAGYLQVNAQCEQSSAPYVISYYEPGSSSAITALAIRLLNGSYALSNGKVINPISGKVSVLQGGELGGACDCCPDEGDRPCVEPEPLERYLCQDGRVVNNRGDCGRDCNYTAVSRIYVCSTGKEVSDPAECGGVIEVLYSCSDGRLVASESACGCPTIVTHVSNCTAFFVEKKYKCADGSVVTNANDCGDSGVNVYYVCSDGRKVASESDCSAQCPATAYPVTNALANIPAASMRLVYECWDGSIVNSRAGCPLYCQRDCQCPDYERPVCGRDGRTYRNRCYLGCAGVEFASDGECGTYDCVPENTACVPATMTVTSLVMNTNRSVCCPGLSCVATPSGSLAANLPSYTCRGTCADGGGQCQASSDCCNGMQCTNGRCAQGCSATGASCQLNSTCCTGYCNPQTSKCDEQPTCVTQGGMCRYVTGAASIEKTCCSGLACNSSNVCAPPPSCLDNGTTCQLGSECCSNYCDPVEFKCTGKPSCFEAYYPCANNSECCGGYCNQNSKQCRTPSSCPDSCQNGVRRFDCTFNYVTGGCSCDSENCLSQRCNSNGTDCSGCTDSARCTLNSDGTCCTD